MGCIVVAMPLRWVCACIACDDDGAPSGALRCVFRSVNEQKQKKKRGVSKGGRAVRACVSHSLCSFTRTKPSWLNLIQGHKYWQHRRHDKQLREEGAVVRCCECRANFSKTAPRLIRRHSRPCGSHSTGEGGRQGHAMAGDEGEASVETPFWYVSCCSHRHAYLLHLPCCFHFWLWPT